MNLIRNILMLALSLVAIYNVVIGATAEATLNLVIVLFLNTFQWERP